MPPSRPCPHLRAGNPRQVPRGGTSPQASQPRGPGDTSIPTRSHVCICGGSDRSRPSRGRTRLEQQLFPQRLGASARAPFTRQARTQGPRHTATLARGRLVRQRILEAGNWGGSGGGWVASLCGWKKQSPQRPVAHPERPHPQHCPPAGTAVLTIEQERLTAWKPAPQEAQLSLVARSACCPSSHPRCTGARSGADGGPRPLRPTHPQWGTGAGCDRWRSSPGAARPPGGAVLSADSCCYSSGASGEGV